MGSYPPPPPPEGYGHGRPGDGAPGYGPTPEILPPAHEYVNEFGGQGYRPPPPPRPKNRWAMAPATYTLLGINCAVFALMFLAGAGPFNPSPESLLMWGANNAGSVLYDGQWWRVVTAMFVHGGFLHLALNMWCLWNLGMLAEPLVGSFGVFAVYILTGAAGNLLSILHSYVWPLRDPSGALVFPVGVGASGAVFGIAGALIILLKTTRLPVPPEELKKLRRSVIYFAAINLVIGFSINAGSSRLGGSIAVDNMAHLGGCACGLLFGVPLVPRIGSSRSTFELRRRIAVTIVTIVLVLFGFFLAQLPR